MGNRAFIAHKDAPVGVYLHWNGGTDTVKPLLDYCRLANRHSGFDSYGEGLSTFVTVAKNMLGDNLFIELNYKDDPMLEDNGTYWIDGWDIVGRETSPYFTEEQDGHNYQDMLEAIAAAQPEARRVSEEELAKALREHTS